MNYDFSWVQRRIDAKYKGPIVRRWPLDQVGDNIGWFCFDGWTA